MDVSATSVSTKQSAWPLNLKAGTVVGVLDSPVRVSGTLAALATAGIQRSAVDVITRVDGWRDSGVLAALANWLNRIGPERELSDHYQREVKAGGALLVIHRLTPEMQAQAGAILRDSDVRCIHAYGRFTVRRLAA
jgi:hypothetical protein